MAHRRQLTFVAIWGLYVNFLSTISDYIYTMNLYKLLIFTAELIIAVVSVEVGIGYVVSRHRDGDYANNTDHDAKVLAEAVNDANKFLATTFQDISLRLRIIDSLNFSSQTASNLVKDCAGFFADRDSCKTAADAASSYGRIAFSHVCTNICAVFVCN